MKFPEGFLRKDDVTIEALISIIPLASKVGSESLGMNYHDNY